MDLFPSFKTFNGLLPRFINTSAASLLTLHSSETTCWLPRLPLLPPPTATQISCTCTDNLIHLTSSPVHYRRLSSTVVLEPPNLPRADSAAPHSTYSFSPSSKPPISTECLLNTTAHQNHNTLPVQDHPQTALCPKFQSNEAGPPLSGSSWIIYIVGDIFRYVSTARQNHEYKTLASRTLSTENTTHGTDFCWDFHSR